MTRTKLKRLLQEKKIPFSRITANLKVVLETGERVAYKLLLQAPVKKKRVKKEPKLVFDKERNEWFEVMETPAPKKPRRKRKPTIPEVTEVFSQDISGNQL